MDALELTVGGSEDVSKVPLSLDRCHVTFIASLILPYCCTGGVLTTALGASCKAEKLSQTQVPIPL